MNIVALVFISLSEIVLLEPNVSKEWAVQNREKFEKLLHSVGLDTSRAYELQENITHRNRFNWLVETDRWVGNERIDPDWVNSGYASQEAIDKSKSSRLLVDLYRQRGQVE